MRSPSPPGVWVDRVSGVIRERGFSKESFQVAEDVPLRVGDGSSGVGRWWTVGEAEAKGGEFIFSQVKELGEGYQVVVDGEGEDFRA